MKLSAATIASLDNLLSTLTTIGIDKVIIEPGKIRAIDEKKTVGTITDQGVPDLDGKTLAVNRIKSLKDRISLAKAQGDVAITATLAAAGTDVSMLEITAGRSKSQFRCATAEVVKVPKTFNDVPAYEVLISVKQIPLIASADAAMVADGITIASKNGTAVTVELVDANKDVYTFEVEKAATATAGGKASSFVFKYPSKSLLSLLRESAKTSTDDVKLSIGAQGILLVDVAGYRFFTLPQA
jgi:uncharacterized membrane protein YkoI